MTVNYLRVKKNNNPKQIVKIMISNGGKTVQKNSLTNGGERIKRKTQKNGILGKIWARGKGKRIAEIEIEKLMTTEIITAMTIGITTDREIIGITETIETTEVKREIAIDIETIIGMIEILITIADTQGG